MAKLIKLCPTLVGYSLLKSIRFLKLSLKLIYLNTNYNLINFIH